MSHAMNNRRNHKGPSNGVGSGELVSLSYSELRLLFTEMRVNADTCDDHAIQADYRRLCKKFEKALTKAEANGSHEPRGEQAPK